MKSRFYCLQKAAQSLVTLVLLTLMVAPASAAALFQFEGETPETRHVSQNSLKLSVLDWSTAEEQEAVIEAFRAWQENRDAEAFSEVLGNQSTRGYLFTGEVTGYTVKYAHQLGEDAMSLLIVPGLKSKNRYMWKTAPAEDAPPFTLLHVELLEEGERASLRTSLETGMSLSEDGSHLIVNEGAGEFGVLEDATPYYLKNTS